MSPLQQEESREKESNDKESDKENRIQVNGSTETKESEEAKTKEVMDYIRTLNSQGKIAPALLPEAKAMDIQLPLGYPGKYSDYGGEINSAVKAAFGKKNECGEGGKECLFASFCVPLCVCKKNVGECICL
jgi:hypothetical protein